MVAKFDYERQLFMNHGSVLWLDVSKHDRVHRPPYCIQRRCREIESAYVYLPGVSPSIRAAVPQGVLMNTPTVTSDGTVWTGRFAPSHLVRIRYRPLKRG